MTSLAYRDGRFPVVTTNAAGHKEYSAYDPVLGVLVQKTGPNGVHTCMTYDAFGRQRSETQRCGSDKELTTNTDPFYTAAFEATLGTVVTRTRAPTGVASWAYADAFGRASFARGRTFGGGFSQSYTRYDRWGRTAEQSVPRDSDGAEPAYVTKTEYDDADRVTSVTRDLGAIDGTTTFRRAIQTFSYFGTTVRHGR